MNLKDHFFRFVTLNGFLWYFLAIPLSIAGITLLGLAQASNSYFGMILGIISVASSILLLWLSLVRMPRARAKRMYSDSSTKFLIDSRGFYVTTIGALGIRINWADISEIHAERRFHFGYSTERIRIESVDGQSASIEDNLVEFDAILVALQEHLPSFSMEKYMQFLENPAQMRSQCTAKP